MTKPTTIMFSIQKPSLPLYNGNNTLSARGSADIITSRSSSATNSIQSSNPDLLKTESFFYNNLNKQNIMKRKIDELHDSGMKKNNLESTPANIISSEAELEADDQGYEYIENDYDINDDGLLVINETTSPLFTNIKSPFSHTAFNVENTSFGTQDSDLEFIHDLPTTLIKYAFLKISSELAKSVEMDTKSADSHSDFTRSSQLTPNSFPNVKLEDLSPRSKREFTRKKVIEELIETEEAYISSLKMLSGIYLASIINKGNNGIPIRQLLQCVDLLIETHESFLTELRKLYSTSLRAGEFVDNVIRSSSNSFFSSYDKAQRLITPTTPLMAALVGDLISQKLIGVYIYQEYSSIHDFVLKLINSKEDDPEIGKKLTKGYQNFLEAAQGTSERMDLSLGSLIQRPIGRLGRYKLFLETLTKLTSTEEDEDCHRKLQVSLAKVDQSIREVNQYGAQEKIRANKLYKNLSFETGAKLNFPVEYLGMPLLLGSLYVTWVSDSSNHTITELLGAFLFKTHLILCTVNKSTNFVVKFLIPLSVSKLVESYDESGGLFCNYENSFKLRFEINFTIVELLLIQDNSLENSVWKAKLDVLINHVNGPYPLDYSASKFNEEQGTKSSTIIPSHEIQFFEAKVDSIKKTVSIRSKSYIYHHRSSDKTIDIFNLCYFSVLIPLKIKKSNNTENYGSLRFKGFKSQKSKRFCDGDKTQLILLKVKEKMKIETYLEDLWSEELFSDKALAKNNNFTRKSTWGSKNHFKKTKKKQNVSKLLDNNERILIHNVSRDSIISFSTEAELEKKEQESEGMIKKKKSSRSVSLIRKTSTVFGDALKSILNGSPS